MDNNTNNQLEMVDDVALGGGRFTLMNEKIHTSNKKIYKYRRNLVILGFIEKRNMSKGYFYYEIGFLCQIIGYFWTFKVVSALDRPPDLECMNDAIRLHFVPEEIPFYGHVYVKGFFFTTRCHLDYTRYPISEPFFFHIPYQSDCQVRRDRASEGVIYSLVVIVQHHRLFVTSQDKAYRVSCFYRDAQNRLEQTLEIGDPTPESINGTDRTPTCRYEVLQGSIEGEPVKYANLGDILIHKWTCDTNDLGILVHSCLVRDAIGNQFILLDDRGCVTDNSLMHPPSYTSDLNVSYSLISAFKFADQMVVYFTCQITLCSKRDQGCEGITPPICAFTSLPNEGGAPMNIYGRTNLTTPSDVVDFGIAPSRRATTGAPIGTTSLLPDYFNYYAGEFPPYPSGPGTNVYGIPNLGNLGSGYESGYLGGYWTYPQTTTPRSNFTTSTSTTTSTTSSTTSTTITPITAPTEAIIFRPEVAAARHARSEIHERHIKDVKKNLTLDVVADQLIILTKDDKMQLNSAEIAVDCSSIRGKVICISIIFATISLALLIVILQQVYFRRRLLQFGGFAPPFELSSIKS